MRELLSTLTKWLLMDNMDSDIDARYTEPTDKSVKQASIDIRQTAEENGWAVLQVYALDELMAAKGFPGHDVARLVKICKASYPDEMDDINPELALFEPCPILVYSDDNQTRIATLDPQLMGMAFPDEELGDLPEQISSEVKTIIQSAK